MDNSLCSPVTVVVSFPYYLVKQDQGHHQEHHQSCFVALSLSLMFYFISLVGLELEYQRIN